MGGLLLLPALVLGLWIAIHKVEWLGPMLADGGRAVLGNDAIAKLEDTAYGLQDRYNQWTRSGEAPKAYWEVPDAPPTPPPAPRDPHDARHPLPTFALSALAPMHDTFAAPGDGRWIPIVDPRHADEPPRMMKTLLHPDRNRSWTAVAIVAVDLRQVDLHLVAGRHEPENKTVEARGYERHPLIAERDLESVLAAFNGGFKTTHGEYGMKTDGTTFVRPRIGSCTLAALAGQDLVIGPWKKLRDDEPKMAWFRQTPQCMIEAGELHVGLRVEGNTHWGATVDRDTVIRRSAIGLDKDRKVLFVSIGDHTTARAIALAMSHAGATDVAQLDVNFSYPKFLTIEPREDGELVAKPIMEGFEFSEDDYVRKGSDRDFFYLTRKPREAIVASSR